MHVHLLIIGPEAKKPLKQVKSVFAESGRGLKGIGGIRAVIETDGI